MTYRALCFALIVLASLVSPQNASAQSFRIQTHHPIVDFRNVTLSPEMTTTETDTSTTSVGAFTPGIFFDLGGVLDLGIAFGAQVGAYSTTVSVEVDGMMMGDSSTATVVRLAPYFEYVIDAAPAVKPALRFSLGYFLESTDVSNSSGLVIGGSLFLHLFPADSFSISPFFEFNYATGSTTIETGMTEVSADATAVQVIFGLSLGGWIGLGDARGEPASEEGDPQYADVIGGDGTFDAPTMHSGTEASQPAMPSRPTAANAAVETVLLPEAVLTLATTPGERTELRMVVAEQSDGCSDLLLGNEGGRSTLDVIDREEGLVNDIPRVRLTASVAPGLLRQWLSGTGLVIVACGRVHRPQDAHQHQLRDYLERVAPEAEVPDPNADPEAGEL